MGQSYVYEEEQYEEGLTFKKIGHFLKKGWLRMLVYAGLLVLVATAIAVPIKILYKSEPVAQTSVEFIYDGIEKGLDPNGGTLDTDNIIAPSVLKNAVDAAKLASKIKDITKLRDSMRVEGVDTDEYVKLVEAANNGDKDAVNKLRNYKMFPTQFDIIISDPDKLGLSDSQAKTLLNCIVKSYYEYFQKRYSPANMFVAKYDLSQNALREFTDIYDEYVARLDLVKSYATDLAKENPAFISTQNGTTFTQLLGEIDSMRNSYDLFNAYILSKNIWRNKATARNKLLENQVSINNSLTPLIEEIEALKKQLEAIQPDTTTSGTGDNITIVQKYPEYYYSLQAELFKKNEQVRLYKVQLANIDTRLDKLPEGDTAPTAENLINEAIDILETIEAQSTELIEKVNATVEDYYKTTFISGSMRQVRPPVVTRRSVGFDLWVVYVAVILGGVLIAGIVTAVKIARANAAAKSSDAETTATDTEQNKTAE